VARAVHSEIRFTQPTALPALGLNNLCEMTLGCPGTGLALSEERDRTISDSDLGNQVSNHRKDGLALLLRHADKA
jgi:hypothetical protein